MGYFKMNAAKQINTLRGTEGQSVWQRGYYEHVIRNERDHLRVWEYIDNNPLDWALDDENPEVELRRIPRTKGGS
jgi:REP element-mobilizing transposase RayT